MNMSLKKQIDEYLARAKEAEDQAAKLGDSQIKQSWLQIALSYRQMAQRWVDRTGRAASAEQPSAMPAAKAEPDQLQDPKQKA
jgi:hypothetical protein